MKRRSVISGLGAIALAPILPAPIEAVAEKAVWVPPDVMNVSFGIRGDVYTVQMMKDFAEQLTAILREEA